MRIRTLTAAFAFAALAVPALAADLPSRAVAPIAPVPLPPSWTGFYAGVHVGALFTDWDSRLGFYAVDCGPCSTGRTASAAFDGLEKSNTSFLGGIQAGHNWQSGSLVYGFEADFSLTGEGKNRAIYIPSGTLLGAGVAAITDPASDGFNGQFKSSIDWLATARARVGLTNGGFLFYATGGLAFADVSTEGSYISLVDGTPPALTPVSVKNDDTKVGWTIGAGIEAKLTDRLSAKVEYNYADLGKTTNQFGYYINLPSSVRQTVSLEEDLTLHVVKFGLNYRFTGP